MLELPTITQTTCAGVARPDVCRLKSLYFLSVYRRHLAPFNSPEIAVQPLVPPLWTLHAQACFFFSSRNSICLNTNRSAFLGVIPVTLRTSELGHCSKNPLVHNFHMFFKDVVVSSDVAYRALSCWVMIHRLICRGIKRLQPRDFPLLNGRLHIMFMFLYLQTILVLETSRTVWVNECSHSFISFLFSFTLP